MPRDYLEMVTRVASGADEGDPARWGLMERGGTTAEMPLWQAVLAVIIDWEESHRQWEAQIILERDGGPTFSRGWSLRA